MPKKKSSVALQTALLRWFDTDRREMPWRETRDPYYIWVSEIMLQQTQVKTVIPYFERWIKSFPTVRALARASEESVLKHWEGLGYYSRARNLHKAAGIVVQEHAGKLPDTYDAIIKLPGIGRYTAGAILSIAYGKPHAVLDGNVKRVLSRLFALNENGYGSGSEKRLWAQAEALLPKRRVGDFNQSLMELGATVCLPQKPMCLLCPVQGHCAAWQSGNPEQYPPPRPRSPAKKIEVSAAVIIKGCKAFIQQRPRGGLMGGLWEFPGGKREPGETPEACLVREIREELGAQVTIREKLMVIRHSYTQFRVTLHVFRVQLESGRVRPVNCEQWKWVRPEDLHRYTFPAANVRIVNYLTNNGKNLRSKHR